MAHSLVKGQGYFEWGEEPIGSKSVGPGFAQRYPSSIICPRGTLLNAEQKRGERPVKEQHKVILSTRGYLLLILIRVRLLQKNNQDHAAGYNLKKSNRLSRWSARF